MRHSTARSSIALAIAVTGLFCVALSARASATAGGTDAPHASSLRVFGAYLPSQVQWEDAVWGYGFNTRVSLNTRWSVDVGASRFEGSNAALAPMTLGFSYGPESRGFRPWVEAGLGYYRRESTLSPIVRIAPSAPYYDGVGPRRSTGHNVGGYAGVGFDAPLSGRLAVSTGLRMHGWTDPDGFVALQSGLSYGF